MPACPPPAPAVVRTSRPASSRSVAQHLAEHGAAGLSLRAVTRDLGMVSSAVYRYVANRDELLTLLLVDAYGAQADAVDAAVASAADQRWHDRVVAAAHAFRAWAVRRTQSIRPALRQPGARVRRSGRGDQRAGHPGHRCAARSRRRRGRSRGRARPAGPARPTRAAGQRPAGPRCRGRARHAPGSAVPGGAGVGHRRGWDEPGGVRAVRRGHLPGPEPGLRPAGAGWCSTCSAEASTRPDSPPKRARISGRRRPGRRGRAPRRRPGRPGTPRGRAA